MDDSPNDGNAHSAVIFLIYINYVNSINQAFDDLVRNISFPFAVGKFQCAPLINVNIFHHLQENKSADERLS